MKVAISTTYDDKYLWFLPIVSYCWNKLGVEVICFAPDRTKNFTEKDKLESRIVERVMLVRDTINNENLKCSFHYFKAPEHKQATYAQCSRLFAACLDLPENEIVTTGDIDMLTFELPPYIGGFTIWGSDLVPPNQLPICYISAKVKDWRQAFQIEYGALKNEPNALAELKRKTYQECLDELLGHIEAEHFRGNFWSKDQEVAFNKFSSFSISPVVKIPRAKPGTQFAANRYDRDDAYILDRLSPDTIDFHMPRPGYEEKNFNIIMTILKYHYPNDDLSWITQYRDEYIKLL